MTAYLKSWLLGASNLDTPTPNSSFATEAAASANADPNADSEHEVSLTIEAPDADTDDANVHKVDGGADAGDGDDNSDGGGDSDATETDLPPAFPALNSAQRMASTTRAGLNANANTTKQKPVTKAAPLPSFLTDAQRMPPPPLPASALRVPGVPPSRLAAGTRAASSSLLPPPSSSGLGATLGVPPTTNKPPVKKFRDKVALAPGFGPLDWAALKASGADLRGVDTLTRVTPSMLKAHRGRDGGDAWTAINGKVYNITPYLPFHPGGEKELMRVAGRDGTKLFGLTHAWVNVEFMLDSSLVGFLVSEPN